jgi:hypothetical protein
MLGATSNPVAQSHIGSSSKVFQPSHLHPAHLPDPGDSMMSKIKFIVSVLSPCLCTVLFSAIGQAQSIVYVTANRGTDLNSCTRTAPCRSIAKGITTMATGGVVEILDTRDYSPFTIDKSVTVEAAPGAIRSSRRAAMASRSRQR